MFVVFVTISKEGGENNSLQNKMIKREEIYAKRIQQIQKICEKYNLSAAEEESIKKSTFKILQSDSTALIAIPPLSNKV